MKLTRVPYRTEIEWIAFWNAPPPPMLEVLILTQSGNVFEAMHDGEKWLTADDGGTVYPVRYEVLAWADQDGLTHKMLPPGNNPANYVPGLPEDYDHPLNRG